MKALKQLYIAVLVLVVGLILIPLFKTESTSQDLMGFTARDIQYIESIGFVDNLDGSWTINQTALTPNVVTYTFEYQPFIYDYGIIMQMNVVGTTALRLTLLGGYRIDKVGGTLTIWGGDVS